MQTRLQFIAWNKRMQELVRMDEIAKDIRYGKPVKETAALEPLTQLQENWLERRLKRADSQKQSG